jgi:hypothetical protein
MVFKPSAILKQRINKVGSGNLTEQPEQTE